MINHELQEDRSSESREGVCILYPHVMSDMGVMRYDRAVEHS